MLTIRRSSGFTLVELLVGLVLLGIVSTTLYRVLTSQQRLARAQTEQVSLQSAVRIGSLLVGGELKEIGISNAGISDISAMSSNSITYRAMRSTALACQVSATEVRIRQTPLFGTRAIAAQQDTMLLFVEGDPDLGSDDQWIVLPITAVTNSTCGGTQAFALATTINTAVTPLANIVLDAPVRTFETMRLGIIAAGGQNWLGVQSVSDPAAPAMQPALGPITGTGLEFNFYNAAGAVTATRSEVRSIQITVRGQTDRTVRAAGQSPLAVAQESLVARITLRNAPHP